MCDRLGSDVLLDHLQRRLTPGRSRDVVEHLKACPPCRERCEEVRLLLELTEGARVEPGSEADSAVANVIRRVSDRRFSQEAMPFEEESKPVRPGTRRIRILRRGRARRADISATNVFWAAAAAVAISFTVLFAALSGSPRPSVAPTPVVSKRSVPAPRPAPAPVVRSVPSDDARELTPVPLPQRPRERTRPDRKPFRAPVAPVPPARRTEPQPAPRRELVQSAPRETVAEPAAPPVEFAKVKALKGRTDRKGSTTPEVSEGAVVFTGQELSCRTGHLLLELEDGSLVAVRAGTLMTPRFDGDHVLLDVSSGEVACSVQKRPERRFAVATPLGSATVRGTMFSVRASGASTVVTVAEGRVEARNKVRARDVAAGTRSTMRSSGMPSPPERVNAHKMLSWAYEAGLRSLDKIWLTAADPDARFQPPMTRSRLFSEGSLSGFPAFAETDSQKIASWRGRFLPADRDEGGWITFTVDVPRAGEWYLWGRMFFPGSGTSIWRQGGAVAENDPNSFYVRVDQGPELVFGNLKRETPGGISWYRRWHWNGDGQIEVGTPAPLKLGTLTAGRHTIRIRNRDAVETAKVQLAPRLDVLCLTLDPTYRPRDEEFSR